MTDMPTHFPMPTHRPDLIAFLPTRRSNVAKVMSSRGPDKTIRDKLLEIAARVPDHRKLTPWRFIIFEGNARKEFGDTIAQAFIDDTPSAPADRVAFERDRLTRAPLVVAVISSPVACPRGTPEWEQKLSSGAVCYNLCLAAQAHGFGAQWLTEWFSYNDRVNTVLGLTEGEQVAGYIYIGTPLTQSSPRPRPDMANLVSKWKK